MAIDNWFTYEKNLISIVFVYVYQRVTGILDVTGTRWSPKTMAWCKAGTVARAGHGASQAQKLRRLQGCEVMTYIYIYIYNNNGIGV